MTDYKKVLLAVELNPVVDNQLIKVAMDVIDKTKAGNILLVHAIEHLGIYGGTYGITISSDIETQLFQEAQESMEKLAKKLHVKEKNQVIQFGSAKNVIAEIAEEYKPDLIVVGTHGKEGIKVMLGSTANAILHHAKCDVLTVRLKEQD